MDEEHYCAPLEHGGFHVEDFKEGGYGHAIYVCSEDKNGRLWVYNGEYASTVNYCPFCGYKAKITYEVKSK